MNTLEEAGSDKPATGASSAISPMAHPLDEFYARMGIPLPTLHRIEPEGVPQPYKSLLVHTQDMTPALEQFHGGRLRLRVLRREQREQSYLRGVTLILDGTDRAVAFGAIKINLALFSPASRKDILLEKYPLGHILEEHALPHSGRPRAFFAVEADDFISRALLCSVHDSLYGRRNSLLDQHQRSLAEVVEILPSIESPRPTR